ncbi:hypothetical protein [Aureimonas frigidaquae]|uniref:hypothetical protein n=1 Tax=Aureimonas frigidaquae TaxID=424757 RepID=UPI00078615C8|nr:hypothetical protein [Aureimonas frigidaquae]
MARLKGTGARRSRARTTYSVQTGPLAELARDHAQDALAALVEIAREGGSEAARISAANAILDRAYGKPSTATPDEARSGEVQAAPLDLSDAELQRIARAGVPDDDAAA